MNKHTRLIVSILFVVLIGFAIAITQFYISVPSGQQNVGDQDEIAAVVDTSPGGISVFSDGFGGLGLSYSGRIIAAPEWEELRFAEDNCCIAGKKVRGEMLYGCIDYDGDLIVPLIYSSIEKCSAGRMHMYTARSAENGMYVLYNADFSPKFRTSWKECAVSDNELVLTDSLGRYVYSVTSDGLLFKRADVSGTIMEKKYELSIISRVLLSKLTPSMIEMMLDGAQTYINYAISGDDGIISEVSPNIQNFKKLFADCPEIRSMKLREVPEIHIYSIKSRGDEPCCEVAVTAEVDITYTDEDGHIRNMTETLRGAVQFSGGSEGTLTAISGSFDADKPEYPEPEEEQLGGFANSRAQT